VQCAAVHAASADTWDWVGLATPTGGGALLADYRTLEGAFSCGSAAWALIMALEYH